MSARHSPPRSRAIPDFRDENELADYRRVVATVPGDDNDPPLGWIETLVHGGAQRPVITRGSMHMRFTLPSVKTGMSEIGEGRGEELLAMLCEVDGIVSTFKLHPYRFGIHMRRGQFTYRPDNGIIYRDGRLEIVEVKRTPEDLDEDEKVRLGMVAEFVRRCGWSFSIRYLEEIRGPKCREHNVAQIFGRRALKLTPEEWSRAKAMRLAGRPIAWSEVAAGISPQDRRHGDAVVERLIAAGWFIVDLDSPLDPGTRLTPTREVSKHVLPGFKGDRP